MSLYNTIKDIVIDGEFKTNLSQVKAIMHVAGSNIEVHKLITVNVDRNYNSNYGDVITIETYMPFGNYVKLIHPNKDSLEVSLIQKRGAVKTLDRYRAIVLATDDSVSSELVKNGDMEDLNKEMAYVTFQLIDLHLNEMMSKYLNGVVNNQDLDYTITCLLASKWYSVTTPGDIYTKTFSLIPPHNTKVFNNILLPPDTMSLDLIGLLQADDHGIYTGGAGVYIQTYEMPTSSDGRLSISNKFRTLWVYPLYNSKVGGRKEKRTKIYVSSKPEFKEIERTYAIDHSRSVRIVATMDDTLTIPNFSDGRNVGNQDVVPRTESVMFRSHQYNDAEVKVLKGSYVDDKTHIPPADGKVVKLKHEITSNEFNWKTESMRMNGFLAIVEWRFSVPDILFPGMPLDFYYEVDGNQKLVKGILHGVYTTIDFNKQMSVSKLFIFLAGKQDY